MKSVLIGAGKTLIGVGSALSCTPAGVGAVVSCYMVSFGISCPTCAGGVEKTFWYQIWE